MMAATVQPAGQQTVTDQLQRWGAVKTFVHSDPEDPKPNKRQHIIERTRRFAPLTRKRAAKKLLERNGADRRRIVAKAAGVKGLGIVPKWAVSPITCTETRHNGPRRDRPETIQMPTELQWIDPALEALGRHAPILSIIVHEEFAGMGVTQKERAERARRRHGGELSYWQYRRDLDKAITWLEGFRARG